MPWQAGHNQERDYQMNTITPATYTCWTPNRPPATGQPSSVNRISSWLVGLGTMIVVGTGGTLCPKQLQAATASQAYRPDMFIPPQVIPTPKEHLVRIREVFSPAVSDLAVSFDVSRQSIYNWLNGEPVAEINANKLGDLARAADMFAAAGLRADSTLLRRKFSQNRTLLQLVQAGESAVDAIRLLIPVLQREAQQREEMAALFARRVSGPATADMDFPAANDDA